MRVDGLLSRRFAGRVVRQKLGGEAMEHAREGIHRRVLRDVGVGGERGRERDVAGVGRAGKDDDLEVLQCVLLAEPAEDTEAGGAGHVDVEKQNRGERVAAIGFGGLPKEGHGIVSVGERGDRAREAEAAELTLEDEDIVRIIVDDRDASENPTGRFVEGGRDHNNRNSADARGAQAGSVRRKSGTWNPGMALGV